MRLFIAVPIPDTFKTALQILLAPYDLPETKIIPQENLHVTLHFIGEYPAGNVPGLMEQLKILAGKISPFYLHLEEIAPGPKLKNPRLIWARFRKEPAFNALVRTVCQALKTTPDHPEYIPHITVARFRKNILVPPNLPVTKPETSLKLQINSLAIWESTLGSLHPSYKIIASFPFRGLIPENL